MKEMYFCEEGHEQIAFTCYNCPLCEAKGEIRTLEDEIDDLKEENQELLLKEKDSFGV